MKEENENVETVTAEVIPNEEQPVIIQPTITPPKVLLEILVYGAFETGTDAKDSDAYKKALELQEQIEALRGKDKFRVRILWKTIECKLPMGYDENEELKEWLIENSSCKYYLFAPDYLFIDAHFIKDSLAEIKNFEKAIQKFKASNISIKKK